MKSETLDYRESKAGIFARCLLDALDLFRTPKAWVFALPQVIASGLLLAGLLEFHRSPLNLYWAPVVRAIAGENALHYPRFFRDAPLVLSALEAAAFWLFFPIGWAAFVHALPRLFWGASPRFGMNLGPGRRRALRVWAGALPLAAIQVGAALFIGQLRTGDVAESPRLFYVAQLLSFGAMTMVQVFGAFVIPAIMLGNLSLGSAWARSWALTTRSFWTTTAFVLLPRLLEIPIQFMIARMPEFWGKLDPDSVGPLLAARIFITILGTMMTIAATSRFYLHVCGEEDS